VKGFLLAGAGLALLNFAVENNENPIFKPWMIILMIVAGIMFLSGLVTYSRRVSNPVVDFGLFRYPTFRHGIILIVLGFIVTGSITLILAILLQNQFGLSPFESGLITFTTALGSVMIKPYIGRLVNKLSYKTVLCIYTLIMSISIFSFCFVTSLTPHIIISLILFIYGITFSIHNNMINVIPYLEVDGLSEISKATSLVSTVQQFSMSLGVSFGILILDKMLNHYGIKEVHSILDPVLGLKAFHITFFILGILGLTLILLNSRFNYKKTGDFKESALSH
jgi:predicted MFS family arabinose efflux permease